jgi:2-keto-myo-inositol isomerase
VAQISALIADGYRGPVSFEPFSPDVHAFTDPQAQLAGSFQFIFDRLADMAA